MSYSSEILLKRFLRYGTGINGQPGDEPTPDGGIINGVSQAKCAYIPATDSTLPERRRDSSLPDGRSVGRSPPGQLSQPVIDEINHCRPNKEVDYADLQLEQGKTYRFRVINIGEFPASLI